MYDIIKGWCLLVNRVLLFDGFIHDQFGLLITIVEVLTMKMFNAIINVPDVDYLFNDNTDENISANNNTNPPEESVLELPWVFPARFLWSGFFLPFLVVYGCFLFVGYKNG